MENSALVSVIIPSHQGSDHICRAVDSVLSQTYKNIEVIVVDDNGKGCEEQIKTEKAMEKYCDDKRVVYLTHDVNKNGSAARNTGIRASHGEYISFLDDDDEFTEYNIEKHINALQELSEDFGGTYCDMLQIRPGMKNEIIGADKSGDLLVDCCKRQIAIGTCVIVLRRNAMDFLKEWDESFRRHQDWEFIIRFLSKYKIQHVDYVGVRRHVMTRHTASNPGLYRDNRIHFLNKMEYIFDTFDKKTKQQIYNGHYQDIAKEYLKNKSVIQFFRWTFKTSNPLKTIYQCMKAGKAYLGKKQKG